MALSLEKKNKKNGGDSKNKGRKTRILTKGKRVKAGRLITLFIKQRRRNNAWLQAVRSSEREIFASEAATIICRMKLKHVLNILLNR